MTNGWKLIWLYDIKNKKIVKDLTFPVGMVR